MERYRRAGGDGPRYGEVAMAWAADNQEAVREVLRTSRWMLTGWKVMSELPNPTNFEAASSLVGEEDVRGHFSVGPDPAAHANAVRSYLEAGFDRVVLMNTGPDPDGFLDFYEREFDGALRAPAVRS